MQEKRDIKEMIAGHTFSRFDIELAHLHELVLMIGAIVHQQLKDALTAFTLEDVELARLVISRDVDIDRLEVEADEAIIDLIARRSPLGSDLRVVITVSKSVSDLEKIGDEIVRIVSLIEHEIPAKSVRLSEPVKDEIAHIGHMALSSLRSAVKLFDVWDEQEAYRVIESHREMDSEFQSELRRVMTYITEQSINVGTAVGLVLMAKSFSRITHHAQNLAEYVLFEIKGVDVRSVQP